LNLPYFIVWEAMKEAKKRGCKIWDFEGIYDARWPNKSWLGFSHFKKSFGGEEIEFPGSFEKWRWPF
jgi:peptidoglycan pentaglycine glycine transferase (the first glycine)